MSKSDPVPTVLSIVSIGVACLALITSWGAWMAQRATARLQRQASQEAGRLQEIETFYKDKRKRLGLGFRVLNGPNEVTVASAEILLNFTIADPDAILWQDTRYRINVGSDDFGLLGISGPEFDFQLGPRRREEWRFPYSVSFNLPDIIIDGNSLYQQIEFTFSVVVSGKPPISSSPLFLGGYEEKPWFGYRNRRGWRGTPNLEPIMLGIIAQKVLKSAHSTGLDPHFKDELEGMVRRAGPEMPAGLQTWLLRCWQEAGKFSDKPTEKMARSLISLYETLSTASSLVPSEDQSLSANPGIASMTDSDITSDTLSSSAPKADAMPDSVSDSDLGPDISTPRHSPDSASAQPPDSEPPDSEL